MNEWGEAGKIQGGLWAEERSTTVPEEMSIKDMFLTRIGEGKRKTYQMEAQDETNPTSGDASVRAPMLGVTTPTCRAKLRCFDLSFFTPGALWMS